MLFANAEIDLGQQTILISNVISALVDGKSKHIPYDDSKLTCPKTRWWRGNTSTVMIAKCGPADYNYKETLTRRLL
ncbi:hypothetical protein PR001_g26668 [Phytophthora rubi]|uniref:Kinesin motor domain-containing protein n=1 Tax=Phytophthora rubi TaxID=129364 RepID=A0A6A3HWT5_9STRA|nr:hypothetical protein PR002_g30926 [Phytophthora rubi]KAE8972228.1 hypothetical protein PR001_g26668 [Phytophthora rubi]